MFAKGPSDERFDPLEPMIGQCLMCRTIVETTRENVVKKTKGRIDHYTVGVWYDLPYAECPSCHTRVDMMRRTTWDQCTVSKTSISSNQTGPVQY